MLLRAVADYRGLPTMNMQRQAPCITGACNKCTSSGTRIPELDTTVYIGHCKYVSQELLEVWNHRMPECVHNISSGPKPMNKNHKDVVEIMTRTRNNQMKESDSGYKTSSMMNVFSVLPYFNVVHMYVVDPMHTLTNPSKSITPHIHFAFSVLFFRIIC